MNTRRLTVLLAASMSLFFVHPVDGQHGAKEGQWRMYSGGPGSTKYSPLDQINEDNVGRLRIAWKRPAVDASLTAADPDLRFSNNFRATPLMVDGVLYSPNGVGLVEAFDPATGATLWVQEPWDEGLEGLRGNSTRGVAYWTDGSDKRVFVVRGEFLTALNAETGQPYPAFVTTRRALRCECEERVAETGSRCRFL